MANITGGITNNLLGLQQLAQGRQELEQRNKSIENNRIASEKLRTFQQSQASGNPDYEAFNEAVLLSPELSKNVLAGIGVQEKRQGLDAADFAVKAASVIDNRPEFMNLVKQRIERIQARGGDPKDTIALAESYLQGDVEGARNSIKAVSAALANQGYLDKDVWADVFGVGGASGNKVQSSNILDDGTVVQVLSNGETRVVDASGKALQGDARANAIQNAQNYGVGLQSSRAGGRTAATINARVAGGGVADQVEAEGAGAGKGIATRRQDFIDRGVSAAEGLPTVKRALTLLNSVGTGGFDKMAIQARQAFGIEGADEGELSYNLGKSVLSQLKETFGAAFTAAEGERLNGLEAGLGRNPATNKRILSQLQQLMESKAKRGKSAALDAGDKFTAQSIDDYMGMSIDPSKKPLAAQNNAAPSDQSNAEPSLDELLGKY